MCRLILFGCFFFFFQAEDGIRDLTVTGVQTCALPIWLAERPTPLHRAARGERSQRESRGCRRLLLRGPLRWPRAGAPATRAEWTRRAPRESGYAKTTTVPESSRRRARPARRRSAPRAG